MMLGGGVLWLGWLGWVVGGMNKGECKCMGVCWGCFVVEGG